MSILKRNEPFMKTIQIITLLIFVIAPILSFADGMDNFNRGKQEYLNGQFHHAEIFLKAAIQDNPNLEEAYFYLGCIYDEQGKYRQAMDMFNIGKDLSTHPEVYWLNLGQVYRHAEEYDRAIRAFEQVISLTDQYPEAYLHAGMVYYMEQDKENTIQSWEKYLELAPNNSQHQEIASALNWLKSEDFHWEQETGPQVAIINNGEVPGQVENLQIDGPQANQDGTANGTQDEASDETLIAQNNEEPSTEDSITDGNNTNTEDTTNQDGNTNIAMNNETGPRTEDGQNVDETTLSNEEIEELYETAREQNPEISLQEFLHSLDIDYELYMMSNPAFKEGEDYHEVER